MPKPFFLCGPAFSRSVWWWRFGGGWLCFRGVSNVRWCGTWCHVVGCEVKWSNVVGCEVTWGELMSKCHVVSCDVVSCHVIWCDMMWCFFALCHVMRCNAMICGACSHAMQDGTLRACDAMWLVVKSCCVIRSGRDVVKWKMLCCKLRRATVTAPGPRTSKYYSVLQSTTPYYKVVLRCYSALQRTT